MLWNCVPVAYRIIKRMIDSLILTVTFSEVKLVFLCRYVNQTLYHWRRSPLRGRTYIRMTKLTGCEETI